MTDSVTLDRFDLALLAKLQQDARSSWVDLAELVHLSPSACQRRVKALQLAGVITAYRAVVPPVAAGFAVEAFVAVRVERQDFALARKFRSAILDKPEVLGCHLLSGSIDFMLRVVATDLRSFGDFIQREILSLPGVKDATSSIVLEEIKNVGPSPVLGQ
ncbi:MAG: Lrp/AsnC family transcriptional regulator [Gammaproteobacteria bacterium]|nr:Lrp/AsnC family transcriptional regulator [Gammaproteobacteria bacterium]